MWLIALYRNAKQMGIYLFSGRTSTDVHQLPNIPLRGTCNSSWVLVPSRMVQRMPLQDALVTMYRVGVVRGTRTARILISNLEFTIYCTV